LRFQSRLLGGYLIFKGMENGSFATLHETTFVLTGPNRMVCTTDFKKSHRDHLFKSEHFNGMLTSGDCPRLSGAALRPPRGLPIRESECSRGEEAGNTDQRPQLLPGMIRWEENDGERLC
jgi:hypothetical protein